MSVVIVGGHDRMVCQYKKYANSLNVKLKYLRICLPI